MSLQDEREPDLLKAWNWEDVDPLTQVVVAGFSGHVGTDEGHMPVLDFVFTASEVLPNINSESLLDTALTDHRGDALRGVLLKGLKALNGEEAGYTICNVGRLAGGSSVAMGRCADVVSAMEKGEDQLADAYLLVLSELAVAHLVDQAA
jgi:hypothetical protein